LDLSVVESSKQSVGVLEHAFTHMVFPHIGTGVLVVEPHNIRGQKRESKNTRTGIKRRKKMNSLPAGTGNIRVPQYFIASPS